MKFQLCSCDEYGSVSILKASTDIAELVKEAKKMVTTDNMENALTASDQQREWTSYFVDFFDKDGEPIDNAYYAGKTGSGKHKLYLIKKGELTEYKLDDVDVKTNFYIGEIVTDRKNSKKTIIYAQRQTNIVSKAAVIDSFTNREMEDKTAYYIVKSR
jgi:hypothetical protein